MSCEKSGTNVDYRFRMENYDAEIECEVNRVIDQILREDRLDSMGLNSCPDPCEANCTEEVVEEPCSRNCAIETSSRFSIRILEALRGIQRKKSTCSWPSCTMEEVVGFIRRNYHYDGDLCSQVETALDQVTAQGFVLKMGANRYHLIGPFACSAQKNPSRNRGCNKNRANCRRARSSRGGRRMRRNSCAPNANSTFVASECNPGRFSLGRLSTVSDVVEEPPDDAFQNRSNRERSVIREDGNPCDNRDHEISILEEIHAPAEQGLDHDRGRVPRDRSFQENLEQINHPVPNERGGVSQNHQNFHDLSVMQQMDNELIEECDGPKMVDREPSSDENMYSIVSVKNEGGRSRCQNSRRQKRRENSYSRNSSDTEISGCSARRRSRRNNFDCSSDADISDESADGDKPWVRNCQNQSRRSKHSGRRCFPCD